MDDEIFTNKENERLIERTISSVLPSLFGSIFYIWKKLFNFHSNNFISFRKECCMLWQLTFFRYKIWNQFKWKKNSEASLSDEIQRFEVRFIVLMSHVSVSRYTKIVVKYAVVVKTHLAIFCTICYFNFPKSWHFVKFSPQNKNLKI